MGFFYIMHICVCVLLITTVLFQEGKAGGLTSVADASQSVFGAKGASSFLTKLTSILALGFMVSSLFLAFRSSPGNESIASDFTPPPVEQTETAAPAADQPIVPKSIEVVPASDLPPELKKDLETEAEKNKETTKPSNEKIEDK